MLYYSRDVLSRTEKAGVKMDGYKNGRTARKSDGRLQAAHQRAEIACQFAAKHGNAGGWHNCEASAQRARKVGVEENIETHKASQPDASGWLRLTRV